MNVFELFAKLTLDTSEFEREASDAERSFDRIGSAADSTSGDAAQAERAVDDFTHSVEETTSENNRAARALDDTEQALGDVRQEASRAAPKLDQAADSTGDLGKNLGDVGESGSKASGAMSDLFGSIMAGATVAGVIGAVGKAAGELVSTVLQMDEATEDYRVATGKLSTAFKTVGYSAETAAKTFKEMYTLLGDTDTAVEASQLLVQLTSDTEQMATWTEIAAGVYGTFGDSLPIEGLIEAANETAKVGQVTGVLADALNWVGISEDDFNGKLSQCASTAERTAIITDTLAAKYEDAAQVFAESNVTIVETRENFIELQEAQTALGDSVARLKNEFQELESADVAWWAKAGTAAVNWLADQIEQTNLSNARKENVLYGMSLAQAAAAMQAWEEEYAELNAKIDEGNGTTEDINRVARLGYLIQNGTEHLAEMREAAKGAAVETKNAAEAVDTMTVSANGFSVEMSNSNMTLEEATERLDTYTSAATEMFSKISTESTLSYQDVLDNMRANIDATNQFSENMALIAGELPTEVANMFYEGGPSVYAGTVAMLAEAYNASDEGLSELTALWEEGGLAGINAFAESIGAENVDPVGELAKTLENDTTVEAATTELVDRAAEAAAAEADTAGFDSAGANAVDSFIAGMRSKLPAVRTAAQAIADEAEDGMNGGGGGSTRAGGLDYVPYDGYPAILHRGESVLTKAEAEEWRTGGGGNTAGITIVQNIQSVPQTPVELAAATAAYFETARWAI